MAQDQVDVSAPWGSINLPSSATIAARASTWRMAVEHPMPSREAVVIDIVPSPYSRVTREFATEVFPLVFLIQPAPFPETLIGNSADFYLAFPISAQWDGIGGIYS